MSTETTSLEFQIECQADRVRQLQERLESLRSVYNEESSKLIHMMANKHVADMKTAKLASFVVNTQAPLHYEAPKPTLQVLPSATETAKSGQNSDLGRVRVDWWYDTKKQQASGKFSDGSYKVKADKGKFLEIAFELDVERTMTVSKTRVRAA